MRTNRPLARMNIHQQIVRELALRILSGEAKPGEMLSTEDIASSEMDVSRTAYREAIKVLTAKGLLESRPKVGTRVRERASWNILDPDIVAWRSETETAPQFVEELFEFRQIIEPEAARLAAQNARQDELTLIREAVQRMGETDASTNENYEADLAFHTGVLDASGNELLASLGHVVEALLLKSFELSSHQAGAREGSVPLHMEVVKQIENRDAALAKEAMTTLLKSARADLHAVLAREGGGPDLPSLEKEAMGSSAQNRDPNREND